MATALMARVDFVRERLPGGDNVPAPNISHGKADTSERMTLKLMVVLVRNAKKSQKRQEGDGKCPLLTTRGRHGYQLSGRLSQLRPDISSHLQLANCKMV